MLSFFLSLLSCMLEQDSFQSGPAAGMASDDLKFLAVCLLYRTAHHLVGNRVGKEYAQIRTTDLFCQIGRHLRKNLSLAFV